MKALSVFLGVSLTATSVLAQTPVIPSADVQIKTAVLAAPTEKRDGATVYGYSAKNEFVVLRKGTNEFVCLADDPAQKGLSVSCYHKDLDPFMERGRVLKREGKKPGEILTIREQEVKSKKLMMPTHPSSLFAFSASDENYNPSTGDVKDGSLRYVVYIPYATAESTGLPTRPEAPGMPWIMDPGTHRAHIMINPPVSTTAHH
ncbi:hypothetical protein GCM10028806_36820 [Spirosoma terrae]|uniref:Uncharacterized protein n=1 Tax=Spirosoma terrae TaxID=1968276 RepID=A0A6L9LKV1_9BACT|nr:hypothetical protein [Spirosoma terrae]NDU97369.1 hypothetical protein [Spirosoma terrae]